MKETISLILASIALIAIGFTIGVNVCVDLIENSMNDTAYVPTVETLESVETCETLEAITPVETLPTYSWDEIPLDAELQTFIVMTCEENGIRPSIVFAMCKRESKYNSDAIGDHGDSYGLLQIQPKWHSERMEDLGCTDLLDPYDNVTVAVNYLSELLKRYEGDMTKALVAYNRGSYKGTVTEYAEFVLTEAERIERNIYSD